MVKGIFRSDPGRDGPGGLGRSALSNRGANGWQAAFLAGRYGSLACVSDLEAGSDWGEIGECK